MANNRLRFAIRAAILAVLFAGGLCRSARASGPSWLEVSSDHFTVLTDANEKQGRQIVDQLERMRWMFHAMFPKTNVDPADPIAVLAIKSYKGFQSLEPAEYLAKGQMRLGGLFLKTQDRNYVLICLETEQEHPYATVYHEYTHLQFSSASDWMPLWLDEGLAEFVQNTEIRDKDVHVGQPSANDILYLRQNQLMPLETMFRVDHNSPYYHEEQKGSIFYAESWALTHYLEIDDYDHRRHRIDQYLELMSHRADPVEAARQAFGDLKQLQASLADYIRSGRYKEFVLNSAAAPLDEAAYRVRAVPQPEADAERADFLAQVGRKEEALGLLDAALSADAKCARCYETKGYLAFRDGDQETARKWYGAAVKLDSQSYLANYYFAAMSVGKVASDRDGEIEASLRSAIRLKPAFAPAYDALAVFFAREHRNLDEAYALETQAIHLDRGNVGYRVNASTIQLAQGKYADALATLKMASSLARTPADEAILRGNMLAAQKMLENSSHVTLVTDMITVEGGPPAGGAKTTPVEAKPKHPREAATGAMHEALGTLRHVECSEPAEMDFQVVTAKATIALYIGNYYKLDLSALGFTPKAEMNPCRDLEGLKARVTYSDSSDKSVDGQAVSIELRR